MLQSSLTQKGQTTIPVQIRQALNLKSGDRLSYEIHDHEVLIKKIDPLDLLYHQSLGKALGEWLTKEDDDAFGDL